MQTCYISKRTQLALGRLVSFKTMFQFGCKVKFYMFIPFQKSEYACLLPVEVFDLPNMSKSLILSV